VRRQSWKQRLSVLSLTALLLWAAAPAAAQDRNDFNQKVISEFRANQGKVGGQFANRPLLLLTTTGAKSGRTLTRPLAYTTDGDRFVVIASFGGGPKYRA
jgi:F420H(2)-dependent quinone reductase